MTSPKRAPIDYWLFIMTFALVIFGLAFVFSAGMAFYTNDPMALFIKQCIAATIGFGLMLFIAAMNYNKLKKLVVPFFFLTTCLLLLVPFISESMKGARSWINLGPFSLQPTEFTKLAIICYLAFVMSKKGKRMLEFKGGILPPLIVVGVTCMIIMLQPDLGSALLLGTVGLTMIIVSGAKVKHLLKLGMAAVAGAGFLFAVYSLSSEDTGSPDYRVGRLTAFLNPWADPQDSGYNLIQSLYAFSHGRFAGAGFGQSIQKLHYLSEAHNDFIFSIIGEEIGFLGATLFLLFYLAFLWRGLVIALRCKDMFGMLAGVGVVSLLGLQAFINMGGVTNTIPLTGVTLPLISYGGSSIMATLMGIGVLLNISRERDLPERENRRVQNTGGTGKGQAGYFMKGSG